MDNSKRDTWDQWKANVFWSTLEYKKTPKNENQTIYAKQFSIPVRTSLGIGLETMV